MTDLVRLIPDVYYDCNEHVEHLRHETIADAVVYWVDQTNLPAGASFDARIRHWLSDHEDLLRVHRWERNVARLGDWADYLVDQLAERIADDGEWSGPDGEHEPLEHVDMRALFRDVEDALNKHNANVRRWDCSPAGYVELSADDVIEVLRKECPHWFAEVP